MESSSQVGEQGNLWRDEDGLTEGWEEARELVIQREGDGLGQRKWDVRESNGSRSVHDTKDWEEMRPGC